MNGWYSDIRSGLRILTRSPGPASLAILVLALGIGLTAAMFSIVYGVVLRGLPIENSEELMHLEVVQLAEGGDKRQVSLPQFLDWREHQSAFRALHAFRFEGVYLSGEGHPERLEGARMTPGAFTHLGMTPLMGRDFAAEDAVPGAEPVALIGHRVWRDRFAGSPDVIGRTVRIDGVQTTVIGVMAEGFQFPNRQEIWRPVILARGVGARADAAANLHVFGRLADGVDETRAQTDFASVNQRLAEMHPDTDSGLSTHIVPYGRYFIGEEEVNLSWTSLGAVGFVLLIACFNVANLLLARASGRARELAMRAVLGAGRWRMVRQGLGESLVLSVTATILGVGLAQYLIALFNRAVAGQEWPFWLDIGLDGHALLFVVFCTFLAAAVSGLIPAWRNTRLNIWATLKDESRGTTRSRLSGGLVIAEVALSCTLLVAAVLMVRTLLNLSMVDFNFETEKTFIGRVTLVGEKYGSAEPIRVAFEEIDRRLENLADVQAAALVDRAPAAEWAPMTRYAADGKVYDGIRSQPSARRVRVGQGFFEAMGVDAAVGRVLERTDRADGLPVAVVNRSLAQRHWPDGDVIGKTLRVGGPDTDQPWLEVVGVVPDLHAGGPSDRNPAAFYVPLEQSMTRSVVILARTRGEVLDSTRSIRTAVAGFDPDLPVYFGGELDQKIHEQLFFYRMVGTIFGLMALTALFLAATGLYGLLSFSVSQRVSELGVRAALGASTTQILQLIVKQGLRQVGWGLAIGLALAFFVARLLESQLFGVDPFDPVTFTMVALILLLVGTAAALVPALRACRIDPVVALRQD